MQLIAGCTAQEYNRRKDNVTLASPDYSWVLEFG
jgi:hypothetical protein